MWKGHWSGNFQLLSALDFLRRLMCQQLLREILAVSGKLLLLVPATTFQPAGRKPNISSQKGSLYPNRTMEKYQQRTQVHTSRGKSPQTAQVVVPKTRDIGNFYVEKPSMFRTFGAEPHNVML